MRPEDSDLVDVFYETVVAVFSIDVIKEAFTGVLCSRRLRPDGERGDDKYEAGTHQSVSKASIEVLRRSCYYTIFLLMTEDNLKAGVEGDQGILVIRGSGTTRGWNGIRYKTGLSERNVGARKLSMNVATIPPGGVAYAHIHVDFEVMLYILEGRVRHEYGPDLSSSIDNQAGDFIFIEPGIPHEVCNLSDTEPVVAVVARSDASEWEHIVDYPSSRRPSA